MSNFTDFVGGSGGGAFTSYYERSSEAAAPLVVSDGTNALSFYSEYSEPFDFEAITGDLTMKLGSSTTYSSSTTAIGDVFNSTYLSSKRLLFVENSSTKISSRDFYGIQAKEILIPAGISLGAQTPSIPHLSTSGFSGGAGESGNNMMDGFWDFMPKGGKGGDHGITIGHPGGVGFSGGAAGAGGGVTLVIAENILGEGTIKARGGNAVSTNTAGGGGGIVIIITKAWAGTVAIDVNGGSPAGSSNPGGVGSYCILRHNPDNSLTLMVHSENGSAADLNGQTPVHGADASIAW